MERVQIAILPDVGACLKLDCKMSELAWVTNKMAFVSESLRAPVN
jgi:hypothetical protein